MKARSILAVCGLCLFMLGMSLGMASPAESQELPPMTFFASEPAPKVTTASPVAPNLAFFACRPGATGMGSDVCTVPQLHVYFCPHVVQCEPCLKLIDAITAGEFHDFRVVLEAPSATQLSKWKHEGAGRPIIEWEDSSRVRRRVVGFSGINQFRATFDATEALVAAGRPRG